MLRSDYPTSPSDMVRCLHLYEGPSQMRQTQMYRLIKDSRSTSGTITGELIFSRVNYPQESFKANKNNHRPQFSWCFIPGKIHCLQKPCKNIVPLKVQWS